LNVSKEYGLDRLKAACADGRDQACCTLAEVLERDLEGFARGVPFADDQTIVLVKRLARRLTGA
jgi:hypothetical protein